MTPLELTAETVAKWLGYEVDDVDADAMGMIIPAIKVTVTNWHGDPEKWGDRVTMGSIMLAAHLYRRRATPGGVAEFQAEGRTYVQRHDPQAAMLLGLGAWGRPVVA